MAKQSQSRMSFSIWSLWSVRGPISFTLTPAQCRFSVSQKSNSRADVFKSDTASVANWSIIYKTGWRGNAYLTSGNQGNGAACIGHRLGEIPAIDDASGPQAAPLTAE